jgi:hypothetical protein
MARLLRACFLVSAALVLALTASLLGVAVAGSGKRANVRPLRLADATMIVEVNATDSDAGLQFFLDGEPWRTMTIVGPDGRLLLDVATSGRLRGYGLTELFSESSEPLFARFPLARFKELFPEGRYRFSGRTIGGRRVAGQARLSHDIPAGPQIVAPADGARIDRRHVVARWQPGDQPAGVGIIGYRAIVTREDPLRIFSADLPAGVTEVRVPAQFLQRGTEYKLEVQAIERSGNQTLTEVAFRTRR